MIVDSLVVHPEVFEKRTGWSIKPQGACKGELCVPLSGVLRSDGMLDLEPVAARLGMPIVADDAHGLWALGPDTTVTGRALCTAVAPDLVVPDVDGAPGRLAR